MLRGNHFSEPERDERVSEVRPPLRVRDVSMGTRDGRAEGRMFALSLPSCPSPVSSQPTRVLLFAFRNPQHRTRASVNSALDVRGKCISTPFIHLEIVK